MQPQEKQSAWTPALPFRKGNTSPDIVMFLDANDNYVGHTQLRQTGGGAIAAAMESSRRAGADYILTACNSHVALVEALEFWCAEDPDVPRRFRAALAKAKGEHA